MKFVISLNLHRRYFSPAVAEQCQPHAEAIRVLGKRVAHEGRGHEVPASGKFKAQALADAGVRGSGSNRGSTRWPDTTTSPNPKPLSDLGISKDQSALWQKLAEMPADPV